MRAAYYLLHYGIDYLAWSVRSIQEHVDAIHFFYCSQPWMGMESSNPCPESEERLRAEVDRVAKKPVVWHRVPRVPEGKMRDDAAETVMRDGAKVVLVVDADELWDPDTVKAQLDAAEASPERNTLNPFAHFWRSFRWVCQDPARPPRVLKRGGTNAVRYADQPIPVLHFGYAQREEIIRYKIPIHGHRGEWREGWLKEKFLAWTPQSNMVDVHPTCGWNPSFGDYFWTPRPVPPALAAVVEKVLGDHPYRDLEVIR